VNIWRLAKTRPIEVALGFGLDKRHSWLRWPQCRHTKLAASKDACDPNNPVRFKDDATADELRAEMMMRIAAMADAGIVDLTALPPPNGGGVDPSGLNGS
jgi:hypothetical protein